MQPLPDRRDADEQHPQPFSPLPQLASAAGTWSRRSRRCAERASSSGTPSSRNVFTTNSDGHRSASASSYSRSSSSQHALVVRMFVIWRELDAEALALALDDLEGEARMGIRSLQHGRDPQPPGNLQRLERAERPRVDDVDRVGERRKTSRHDLVVRSESPKLTDEPIGHPHPSSREGRRHGDVVGERALHRRRQRDYTSSRGVEAPHLLPRRVTDPSCADPVREAVEDPQRHRHVGT